MALDRDAFLRSLVIPGVGQAHQGRFFSASLFGAAAVISGVGLVVSQINYNQSVDNFRQQARIYAAYQDQLDGGAIVSIESIDATFSSMQHAFDQADRRLTWRNVFLASLITTYALNLVDVVVNSPPEAEGGLSYSVDVDERRVLLVRDFRF
jgi:hypothetical protein